MRLGRLTAATGVALAVLLMSVLLG
jgi:hypothetical protein